MKNADNPTLPETTDHLALTPVAISFGDGIGPEIMEAVMIVLVGAGARIDYLRVEVGEAVYKRGFTSGIEPEAWQMIRRAKAFLKAPITTPQGGRIQKPQCNHSKNARSVRERAPLYCLLPLCANCPSRHGYYQHP